MFSPRDEKDLSDLVAGATDALAVIGGGTRTVGAPVQGGVLTTSGLSGITLYDPGALTLVAQAGTPVSEIEAALDAENQMLAFEPMDHRTLLDTEGVPTIGGVVGANVSGPRRVQAGACRDFLLGVRCVDGSGTIVKNGGRVMKNVTGYDLARLMCGSRGTLGILSEVGFKVLPKPEATAVLLLTGLTIGEAVKAMASALTSPFEVTGAAHVPVGLDSAPVTMLRLEGFEDSVAYRANQLKARLAAFGPADIERRVEGPENTKAGWAWVRDVAAFAEKTAVWRVSVKASEVEAMLESGIWQTLACDAILDLGGGLVWIGADDAQLSDNANWDGSGSSDRLHGAENLHATLQECMRLTGGHATLVKGPEALRSKVPVFQPEPAPLATLAQGLRRQFDPKGILNPGLMGQ
ncbi:MAG: FAD-binding protein [Silicimonas sp.]|nr:FAD-binding protein [Silicimonas sp.]